MQIAVDARFYGTENTGLGRYTTNVLAYLPRHLEGHSLKILLRKKYYDTLKLPKNCEKVMADFPHYSLAEQILLPRLLKSLHCDLLYSLHFNVPLNCPVPFVVTIHDLIKSHFRGADTTTRAPWLFHLKQVGYDYTIKHAINDSVKIIVPSNTVKNNLLATFDSDPTKITTIPEAPDAIFRSKTSTHKLALPEPYLLYVGNAYPHKNLNILLDALASLPKFHLVIVAKQSTFLAKSLYRRDMSKIHVISDLNDQELVGVYRQAAALVTPSLMEGYGLPGLEALMVGTPVVASNIPVYREVYGERVTYFDPHSSKDLVQILSNPKFMIHDSKFTYDRTWDDVAGDIAEVIDETCHRLRPAK